MVGSRFLWGKIHNASKIGTPRLCVELPCKLFFLPSDSYILIFFHMSCHVFHRLLDVNMLSSVKTNLPVVFFFFFNPGYLEESITGIELTNETHFS